MGIMEELCQRLDDIKERLERMEKLLHDKSAPVLEQFFDVHEAGEFVRLSAQTVYGLVHTRQIPHSKKGNRLYFKKSELETWMSEGRRRTMTEIKEATL